MCIAKDKKDIWSNVMVNFGCQPDWIWVHLKGKLLGPSVEDFLDQMIWSGRHTLNVDSTVPCSDSLAERKWKKETLLMPACLHSHLATSSTLPLQLLGLIPASLASKQRLTVNCSLGIFQAIDARLGLIKHPASQTEQLLGSWLP